MDAPPNDLGAACTRVSAAMAHVRLAFGAPGDWGYSDPKGQALYQLYQARGDFDAALVTAHRNGSLAVVTAAIEGATPPFLREQFQSFAEAHKDKLAECRMSTMIVAHAVRGMFAEQDRLEALRFITLDLLAVAALLVRGLKQEQGEVFSPARFAMVALNIAEDESHNTIEPLAALAFAGALGDALQHPHTPQSKAFWAAFEA